MISIKKKNLTVLRHLLFIKNIELNKVSKIDCSKLKVRFHNFIDINLYYYHKNQTLEAQLLFFKFNERDKIVELLNYLDDKITIDKISFELIGIRYVNNQFLEVK